MKTYLIPGKKFKLIFNLERLPFFLIMLIMLLAIPLILTNAIIKVNTISLYGVKNAKHPFPSTLIGNEFINKIWQNKFEDWLNFKIPFRVLMIKIHNQIYYSLFAKIYMQDSQIIIGKKNYLYGISYLLNYCNTDNKIYNKQQYIEWLNKLQALNDFFQKRGQKFIYIMTPSKASYYPEYIPNNYHCNAQVRPGYTLATQVLKNARFPYVDASSILQKNKATYEDLLFPRGGIHWTKLAASLIVPTIFKDIEGPRSQVKITYTTNFHPDGTDSDLLDLSNLLLPNKNYRVPRVSLIKYPHTESHKPKIALIGGSFLGQLLELFSEGKYFKQMDYYNYFSTRHFHMQNGIINTGTLFSVPQDVNLKDPQTFHDILDADVVILEENESMIPSSHLTQLVKALNL